MPTYRRQPGFTLIELIVVIGLVVILAGLAAVSYTAVQQKGRDAQRKNDLNQIKIALTTYYNAQVPVSYVASSGATPPAQITIDNSTDALSLALKPNFLKTVPIDPINVTPNVYKYQSYLTGSVNTDFKLFATLENKTDPKGQAGGVWVTDGYVVQNE